MVQKLTPGAAAALYDAGYSLYAVSPERVSLVFGTSAEVVRVIRVPGSLTPTRIARDREGALDEGTLYVLPRISQHVRQLAERYPRMILVGEEDGIILRQGDEWMPGKKRSTTMSRGRIPWGRWAVMRALLSPSPARTQSALAGQLGLTQGAVSNALRLLGDDVVRTEQGWRATCPADFWDRFITEYPGPGGVRTTWYSSDPIVLQSNRVTDAVDAVTAGTSALISGDAGVDAVAPWRHPRRGVIYSRTPLNLEALGFSSAHPARATLDFVLPEDPTIWATATLFGNESVADPLLLAAELDSVQDSDSDEAARQLKEVTLGGS